MSNSTRNYNFTFSAAHPNAQKLMTASFLWSPIEETSPFGNDDGHDAAYEFRDWRQMNKSASPVVFLHILIERWQYPTFDYEETNAANLKTFIVTHDIPDEALIQQRMQETKSTLISMQGMGEKKLSDSELRELVISTIQQMGIHYLTGQDNAIIAISFAQFATEGKIDADIRSLAISAIQRELSPLLLGKYEGNSRKTRRQHLTEMLEIIKSANA